MIEVRLEPVGAAVKHVVGKSRLSVQTHKVFFPQLCNVCAKEHTLHCKGNYTEDKTWIVQEHGDSNFPACLRVVVSRHTALAL